jgi:hypothetical protein
MRPHTGQVLSVLPMDHDIEKLVKFLPPKATVSQGFDDQMPGKTDRCPFQKGTPELMERCVDP